jgi:hypothetical protein
MDCFAALAMTVSMPHGLTPVAWRMQMPNKKVKRAADADDTGKE